jgi:hypothetical protein
VFDSTPATGTGALDYSRSTLAPVRGATVELVSSSGTTLATGATDVGGNYTLTVALQPQSVFVRVRAEIAGANYAFSVRDNTRGGALYSMASPSLLVSQASPLATMNLFAPAGWDGTRYVAAERLAAPFAILDVAYKTVQKVLQVAPTVSLVPLNLFWSPNNIAAGNAALGADVAQGRIGTSSFVVRAGQPELYLLGDEDSDTDEFDQPVVAHELGHYLQFAVSRDDSQGGAHSLSDKLDMRIAFSEGFGNAMAGMALNSPVYHDSSGTAQAAGFAFSLDTPPAPAWRGWFNENTVQHLLWQAHQDVTIGFRGVFQALVALKQTPVFTSIHSYLHALRQATPAAVASINARAATHGVSGLDAQGASETNDGGLATSLPVYRLHMAALGASATHCLSSPFGVQNKHGNHVYLRLPFSGTRTISVTRSVGQTVTTDPDLTVITGAGVRMVARSATPNAETLVVSLSGAESVMAIEDYNLIDTNQVRCFDVRVD